MIHRACTRIIALAVLMLPMPAGDSVDLLCRWVASLQMADGGWLAGPGPAVAMQTGPDDMTFSKQLPMRVFTAAWCGLALQAHGGHAAAVAKADRFVSDYLSDGYQRVRMMPTWVLASSLLFLGHCQAAAADRQRAAAMTVGVRNLFAVREGSGFWGHGRLLDLPPGFRDEGFYRELTSAHSLAVVALHAVRRSGVAVDPLQLTHVHGYFRLVVSASGTTAYTSGAVGTPPHGQFASSLNHRAAADALLPVGRAFSVLCALDAGGEAYADETTHFQCLNYASANIAHAAANHTPLMNLLWASVVAERHGFREPLRDVYARPLAAMISASGAVGAWRLPEAAAVDAEIDKAGTSYRSALMALILMLQREQAPPALRRVGVLARAASASSAVR